MNQVSGKMQPSIVNLTELVDARRFGANQKLDPKQKIAYGQYMTPRPIAHFMASLFLTPEQSKVHLLDAGAGVGSLTAAFVAEICSRKNSID